MLTQTQTFARWRPQADKPHGIRSFDEAAETLQTFVRKLPARFAAIGLQCTRITPQAPQPRPCAYDQHVDRGWRFAFNGHEIWCIANIQCQHAVLSGVLDGTPSANLTAIERSIFAETMGRLLNDSTLGSAAEEHVPADPPLDCWSNVIDIMTLRGDACALNFCTPVKQRITSSEAKISLSAVPLVVSVQLAPLGLTLRQILCWNTGTCVPLRRKPPDVNAHLYVSNRRLGYGKLGSVLGERAVNITSILSGIRSL